MFEHDYAVPEIFALEKMPAPSEFLSLAVAGENHRRACAGAQKLLPGMQRTRDAYETFLVKIRFGVVSTMDADERLEYHDAVHTVCLQHLHSVLHGFTMNDMAAQFDIQARVIDRVLGGVLGAFRAGVLSNEERRAFVAMTNVAARNSRRIALPPEKMPSWAQDLAGTIEEYEYSYPQDRELPDHYAWITEFRRRQTITAVTH